MSVRFCKCTQVDGYYIIKKNNPTQRSEQKIFFCGKLRRYKNLKGTVGTIPLKKGRIGKPFHLCNTANGCEVSKNRLPSWQTSKRGGRLFSNGGYRICFLKGY